MPNINLKNNSLKDSDLFLVDDPARVKLHTSAWQRFLHPIDKHRLDKQMQRTIGQFFQERYGIASPQHFKSIWNEVSAKIWSSKELLSIRILRKIDHAFTEQLVYHGPGISHPGEHRDYPPLAVQQVVKGLLHGGPIGLDLINRSLIEAVFFKKSPEWLSQFRTELEHELDNLAANPPKSRPEKLLWEAFLGNIISMLPFSYPENNSLITIPRLDEAGACQKIDYRMEIIELTPTAITTPISAIGFTPINNLKMPPMISFLGTTYPAGDGFAATVMSDFTPGMSVGEAPYHFAKNKIEAWMKDKKNIHALGISLGGALTFHTLLHHQNQLSRIDVYNPPGLYDNCWKGRQFNKGCEVNIYCQSGDLISNMGSMPTGKNVNLYYVLQDHPGVKEGMLASHATVFTGLKKVTIIKKEPQKENQKIERKMVTVLHRYMGPWLFFLPTAFLLGVYGTLIVTKKIWSILMKHTPLA